MLRTRLTAIFAWLLLSLGAAAAANLPLISGPIDPSNQIANFNQVIQSINSGVTGNIAEVVTPVTTIAATIQTLATVTLTPNFFTSVGQSIHVRAFGVNDSNADPRTFTLSFGGSTIAQVVTGTSANWYVDCTVIVTLLGATGGETAECHSQEGTSVVASVQATNWAVPTNAAITVLLEGTAATAGTMTLNGAVVEQLK